MASGIQPMPLTLRANVGDCIKVKLTNRMKEGRAFLCHQPGLRPQRFFGGECRQQSWRSDRWAGENRTYTYYETRSLARRPLSSGIGAILW